MEVIQRLYTQIYNACDGDEDYIGTWGKCSQPGVISICERYQLVWNKTSHIDRAVKHSYITCTLKSIICCTSSLSFTISGTYIVLLIVFWGFNIPLTFVDLTGKPAWVKKFKIQHGKNEPVSSSVTFFSYMQPKTLFYEREYSNFLFPFTPSLQVDMKMFRRLIETVVFNNIILNMALLYPAYWLQKWRGMSFKPDGVSTLPWFLVEVIAYTMVNEVVFYYTHR